MDVLAFSLAGIGETNDAWRQGTSFQQVLEAIRSLQACKRRLGKLTPRVHIAYMLLRSGLADLEKLPMALQGLGDQPGGHQHLRPGGGTGVGTRIPGGTI